MADIYSPSNGVGDSKEPFRTDRCQAGVTTYIGRWPRYGQCSRAPVAGGWCRQHHPHAEKAREEKAAETHRKAMRKFKLGAYGPLLILALEKIRDGHNDPRFVAAEALKILNEGE